MKRIQYKLLIILLIAALMPMLITELISLRTAKSAQEVEILTNLDSIAQQKKRMIEELFVQEQSHIQIVSQLPMARRAIDQFSQGFAQGTDSESYQVALAESGPMFDSVRNLRQLENIYAVSATGDIVYSTINNGDFGTNLFNGTYKRSDLALVVNKAINGLVTSHSKFNTYPGDNNKFSAFIATPIMNENRAVGALVFQLTAKKLNPIANDYTALESTGETVLARLDGERALFITPLRFNPDAANQINIELNKQEAQPIREAVQGVNGQGKSIDYRAIPILASWHYLPNFNIGMVVKIDQNEAFQDIEARESIVYLIALLIAIPCIIFSYYASRRFTQPIINIVESTKAISKGELEHQIKVGSEDEIGQLASSINEMSEHINRAFQDAEAKRWLQRGLEELSQTMRGNQISTDLSDNIVAFVSNYLNAKVGSLYIVREKELELAGGFAFVPHFGNQVIAFGDGLVGQVAITKQYMTVKDLPQDYISISSSMGEIVPKNLLIYPIIKEDIVYGVIELGWLNEAHPQALTFLDAITESVGTALGVADSHHKLQVLLDQSQQQMEELQVREEELRAINEEVEQRSKQLAQSQKDLEQQSNELQVTNEALEQKTLSLESKNAAIEAQNKEIEHSKKELELKAEQLEASSKYKSEFLANMSHELRTPLNSMLILSRILSDNDEGNLDEDQIESAQVIHNSGNQLLNLINDILDLSKIEAGKMEVNFEDYSIDSIINELVSQFKPLAKEKGLALQHNIDEKVLRNQSFDVQKTQQILKNLLSNSFKFTEVGSVSLNVNLATSHQVYMNSKLNGIPVMAISVTDTGIGISKEKRQAIFEAFQQADGSTSRKYGGTGLGLTISRHLTDLVGGELCVTSASKQGSEFTLYIPVRETHSFSEQEPEIVETPTQSIEQVTAPTTPEISLPHLNMPEKNEKLIVIVEDDENFANILAQLANKAGFDSLHASSGHKGLEYIHQNHPCGVILDLGLPDIEGSELLAQLKDTPQTKDIPVHVISGDTRAEELKRIGAQGYHQKPVDRQQLSKLLTSFSDHNSQSDKQKLIIFDDSTAKAHLDLSFINHTIVDTVPVHSFDELSHNLGNSAEPIQGIIIKSTALTSQCSDWFDYNYQYIYESKISVVLFVDTPLNPTEQNTIEKYGCHVILDGPHSEQRLHDEVSLFLSQFKPKIIETLNETAQQPAAPVAPTAPVTTTVEEDSSKGNAVSVDGCNVLLVDDDLRNTFALSKVLKKQGMIVTLADNGQMALDKLAADDKIDIVLMDIMMPVMDGYEAMTQIRQQPKYDNLPIIALTAKAMQEDRRKCVEAGASDYLTKPVDVDKLVAMMKVWLYKEVTKID